MVDLQGLWRLDEARSWDVNGQALPAPYGSNPIGQIAFSGDRMLASLCNGDAVVTRKRDYMSYGGVFSFEGGVLDCLVDISSDGGQPDHAQAARPPLRRPHGATGIAVEQSLVALSALPSPRPLIFNPL